MLASPVLMVASVKSSPTILEGVLPHMMISTFELDKVEINPTSYNISFVKIYDYVIKT